MKKLLVRLVVLVGGLLLVNPCAGQTQAPAWQAAQLLVAPYVAGKSAFAAVTATATDAAGNVFVGGTFRETLTLGTSTLNSPGAPRGFVAKWSPASGTYVWAQPVDVYSLDALTISGTSIYVAGTYLTNATFGATTLTNYNPQNNSVDVFVAKLVDAGTSAAWSWAQRAGGSESESVAGLAVSGATVYIGLNFFSSTVNFGGLSVVNTRTNPGQTLNDVAVARLTDAGNAASYAWAVGAGGAGNDVAHTLAVSGSTLYVGGSFELTATFPGAAAATSAGYTDGFVAQLADAGSTASYTWVQALGTANDEEVQRLALNGSALYVAGNFYGPTLPIGTTTLTNAGGQDGFVARYTPSATAANPAWAQRLGGANNDYPLALLARGSSVYVAGTFNSVYTGYPSQGNGTATFGPTTLTTFGASDVFVARLTDAGSSGGYAWVQQAGGNGDDAAVSLTSSGTSLYAGGSIYGTSATFGAYTFPSTSNAASPPGGFLARLTDAVLPTRTSATLPGLTLFPSPAHGMATVQIAAGTLPTTLSLLDALGRAVRTYTVSTGQPYPLDLTGLAPGVYALRVQAGEAQAVQRLVVE